jgi:putative addiction module antidote
MAQKIIKVGNSLAVTIPRGFVKKAGWKAGDEVVFEGDSDMGVMLLKDKSSAYNAKLTPEFKEWLDDFTEKNKDLLKELAKT